MARSSEIHLTADMLRRVHLADIAPCWVRDLCGLVAVSLFGAGMMTWAIVLTSLSQGG